MPGPHCEEIRRCILLFLCTLGKSKRVRAREQEPNRTNRRENRRDERIEQGTEPREDRTEQERTEQKDGTKGWNQREQTRVGSGDVLISLLRGGQPISA